MRRTIEFSLREPQDMPGMVNKIPPESLIQLEKVFPELVLSGHCVRVLRVRQPDDSPRLKEVLAALWELGYRPVLGDTKGPMVDGTYLVSAMQYAEPEDLEPGGHVEFGASPENGIGDIFVGTQPDGTAVMVLDEECIRPEKRLGYLTGGYTGCSREFRRLMEEQGFAGLAFEAPPLREGFQFPPGKELDILSSSLLLPPIKNALPWEPLPIDGIGAEEAREICWSTMEDDYRPPVVRFDRAAFEALGDFDIARSREVFGAGRTRMQPRPRLVVSQRLRRWLDGQGLKCRYHPIRLEDPGDPPPDPPLAAVCRELGMPPATQPA